MVWQECLQGPHLAQAAMCETLVRTLRSGHGGGMFGEVRGKASSTLSALALNSTLIPLSFYLVYLVHTHIHVHIMYVHMHNLCTYIYIVCE